MIAPTPALGDLQKVNLNTYQDLMLHQSNQRVSLKWHLQFGLIEHLDLWRRLEIS